MDGKTKAEIHAALAGRTIRKIELTTCYGGRGGLSTINLVLDDKTRVSISGVHGSGGVSLDIYPLLSLAERREKAKKKAARKKAAIKKAASE